MCSSSGALLCYFLLLAVATKGSWGFQSSAVGINSICSSSPQKDCQRPPTTRLFLAKAATKKNEVDGDPRLAWLQKDLKVGKDRAEKMLPHLNTINVTVLEHRANWLQQRFNWTGLQLRKAIQSQPKILRRVPENVEPLIAFLPQRLSLTEDEFAKAVCLHPRILMASVSSMASKIDSIQNNLQLSQNDLARISRSHVDALNCGMETATSVVMWLKDGLGLSVKRARTCVVRNPQILQQNPELSLKLKFDCIQQRMQLTDEDVINMLLKSPRWTTLTCDTLKDKLEQLREALDLDDDELTTVVSNYPSLLNLSIGHNIVPTIAFFQEILGASEGRRLIMEDPAVLTRSLEKRLKPRLQEATKAGIDIDEGCLKRMAKQTDECWDKSVAYQIKKKLQNEGSQW